MFLGSVRRVPFVVLSLKTTLPWPSPIPRYLSRYPECSATFVPRLPCNSHSLSTGTVPTTLRSKTSSRRLFVPDPSRTSYGCLVSDNVAPLVCPPLRSVAVRRRFPTAVRSLPRNPRISCCPSVYRVDTLAPLLKRQPFRDDSPFSRWARSSPPTPQSGSRPVFSRRPAPSDRC